MRNRFCLRQVANKEKRRLLSWTCIPVCVLAIILTPLKGQCSKSEMFSTDKDNNIQNLTSSPSNVAELTIQSNSLAITQGTESNHKNRTFESVVIQSEEQDITEETQPSKPITDSTVVDSIENAILPEPEYDAMLSTSSLPDLAEKILESTEDDAEEREYESLSSSTRDIGNFYDEEETSSKSITINAYDDEFEVVRNDITGKPKATRSSTSIPTSTTTKAAPLRSTSRGNRIKYPILKKVPTRLIAVSKNRLTSTTTNRPTKKVARNTTKKPLKPLKTTKPPMPLTPTPPRHHRNPHHPHGVVVFDKRKKRPKPGRNKTKHKTKPSTTTTTTTARTTTTTSTPPPSESEEYYEYYWNSGENTESTEVTSYNSTSSNTTTTTPNKKRISSKIPLSKLAMAMIASSTIFDNSTGSEDGLYYPKTPVNLLNILQSYTKQLQLANAESAVKQPVVQIQSSPFMVQLSQLPFGTRIAISIYYSLIAIIPLIYLAFGGLGRLGLTAFAGRGFGRRRRRRRSYSGDHFGLHSRYQTPVIQRADLNERNEDEYMWILGRISEIILEFSLMSGDREP